MLNFLENTLVHLPSEPRLQHLSSAVREVLCPIQANSLATLVLLTGLGSGSALAATINVNASCTLVDAITAANTDTATGGCSAGVGADTLVLPVKSIQLLMKEINLYTGLPVITTPITIEGNGSIIKRGSTAPDFRIFAVDGELILNSTTVSGGRGTAGGALINNGKTTLNNTTVTGNSVPYSGFFSDSGGGIFNNNSGILTINNSTVSGNSAANLGGGLINYGTLTINNSTISGNSVTGDGGYGGHGGGVLNEGTLIVKNTTISGNSAINNGGGVENFGTFTLSNSTMSGNSAGQKGGGVRNANGSFTLFRSLISGNTATLDGPEVSSNTAVVANNYNLFGHDGNAGIYGFTPGSTDIVSSKPFNAILKPLGVNGGATKTHLLVKSSPAINASPNDAKCAPKLDQRGVTRPQGAACDIGAVEVTFCDTATPTTGCIVNGVTGKACIGTTIGDTIVGTSGADVILGLNGNDILKGADSNDKLCGGLGIDRLEGGSGADQLFGSFGDDTLLGGSGDDSLDGDNDNDNLDGGAGADKLNGGSGTKDKCITDADDLPDVGCEL